MLGAVVTSLKAYPRPWRAVPVVAGKRWERVLSPTVSATVWTVPAHRDAAFWKVEEGTTVVVRGNTYSVSHAKASATRAGKAVVV